MPDVIAAVDETAANVLLHDAENARGTVNAPGGSTSSGPLILQWSASTSFSGGTVALTPPNVIAIDNCAINYELGADLGIDLSFLDFCLPQVCVPIPCVGNVCTPQICLTFPTISFPVSFSSSLTFSAEFELEAALVNGDWEIDIVILGIPTLDLGPAATALLEAITIAVAAALAAVPFMGPILSLATAAIAAAFGIAEVEGLLGDILTPIVSGLKFNLYKGESGATNQHNVSVRECEGTLSAEPACLEIALGDTVLWVPDKTVKTGLCVRATDGQAFDSSSLATNSLYTHAFGRAGRYRWCDAHGSGLDGEVLVTMPEEGKQSDWLEALSKGTVIHVSDDQATPASVQVLVGQTVFWAVAKARGVSITDVTLLSRS